MGIITNLRNKAVEVVKGVNDGATNVLDSASTLSDKQLHLVEAKKQEYLQDKPKMNSDEREEFIKKKIGMLGVEVYNAYLSEISNLYRPIEENKVFDVNNRIAYFEITKWVKDPEQNNLEKLMNVYQVLGKEECNIGLIYQRRQKKCHIYLAVVNNSQESDMSEVQAYKRRLLQALRGNFPGTELITEAKTIRGFGIDVPACLKVDIDNNRTKSIAMVSNIATEKSEKYVTQTIENLLDGIIPEKESEEYTVLLLATPTQNQFERKNRLCELYTDLAPYASWQTNYTLTEGNSVGNTATVGVSLGANVSNATSVGANMSVGVNMGGSANVGTSVSNTTSVGASVGANFAKTTNVSVNLSKNEGITQSYTNYSIKHTLEILEQQVQRAEESIALGLWDSAAYVISEDSDITNNVAHTYLAMSQGEESYFSEASVNLWKGDLPDRLDGDNEAVQAQCIMKSLSRLQHPEFALVGKGQENEDYLMYPSFVNATVNISGKELVRALNFPQKSIAGVPVVDTAAFGRNISSYQTIEEDLRIGNIYHMHHEDANNPVELSSKSLASHVFVTGSTGAGKSNTVSNLVSKLCLENTKEYQPSFMIVEPAKGEYKDLLGGYESVSVYGTNPKITELLRINPFAFPKNITVSEHVDRLLEIFNVCWPMYAAMPAILKDAIIRAYEAAGWDMIESYNRYDDKLFPNFDDVKSEIRLILNSSEYSAETKGDYTGALLSRLNSLTNGINAQIFTSDEISNEQLFDSNVIVDLSIV